MPYCRHLSVSALAVQLSHCCWYFCDACLLFLLLARPACVREELLLLARHEAVLYAGIAALSHSSQLTSLNLAVCRDISDTGVATVAALPKLHTLDLTFCDRITDAGVAHLSRSAFFQVTAPHHLCHRKHAAFLFWNSLALTQLE